MRSLLLGLALLAVTGRVDRVCAQNISGGFKIGIAATTFTGKADSDFSFRSGLGVGGHLQIDFANGFLLQPELLYVVKGAKSQDPIINGVPTTLSATFTVSYLEVPVLLAYRLSNPSPIHPRVFAGPFVSARLESRIRARDPGSSTEIDQKDTSIEDVDYGVATGLGLDLGLGGQTLTFEARASIGLSDIRNRPDKPVYNRGVIFLVGLDL